MIDGISDNLKIGNTGAAAGASAAGGTTGATGASGGGFADALKNSIDEVSRLQQDASQAIEDLATGKNSNVTGVMSAMEKSDMAFKTLLAIRSKLLDAYDEIKSMPI